MAQIKVLYNKTSDLTLFIARGPIAAGDLVGALQDHLGTNPTNNVIWDLCGSDLSNMDMAGLTRVSDCARRLSKKRPRPRTIFTVKHEQEVPLLKLYQEISALRGSPVRYEFLHSLQDAYKALAVDNPFVEEVSACP